MDGTDVGLLAIRVIVGLLMVGHGIGNLFPERWVKGIGAFGIEGTGRIFEQLGFRPGRAFAALAGVVELGSGVLLAFGLLMPLATAGIVGLMLNTIFTRHRGNGPWYYNGGWEYNVTLLTVAAALGFAGPGEAALDPALGLELAGWMWGLGGLALGVVTGVVVLTLRRSTQPATSEPQEVA